MARERRAGLPFPAARLEVEKGVEPRIERVARTPAAERHRPLFGEAVGLTAPFLALLRAPRGFPIGGGRQVPVEQRAFLAVNLPGRPAPRPPDVHQSAPNRPPPRPPAP